MSTAIKAMTGCKIYIDGYDRSGDYNKVNVECSVDELESTSLGDTAKEFIAGYNTTKFDGEVFTSHGVGEVETVSHANMGAADKLITVYPITTQGGIGYAFKSVQLSESPVMAIGDLARLTIKASQSGGVLVRVTNMEGHATKTVTGNGTATLLGAVSAAQVLYSFLHVTGISGTGGPTLTVTVKSDDAVGFPSATTRLTHTAMSAIGTDLKTLAGPITDTYYRVDWAITGTTPSFTFNVGVGIQ
jgi:hypothetical protein